MDRPRYKYSLTSFAPVALIGLLLLSGCSAGPGFPAALLLGLLLAFALGCQPYDRDRIDEFILRALLKKESNETATCNSTQDYTQSFDLGVVDPAAAGFGFVISGENAADRFGRSISSAGDFNGDGIGDILVAATQYNTNVGRAYVIFGRSGVTGDIATAGMSSSTGIKITGLAAADQLGDPDATALAGDVNGDGFDDILVGMYRGNTNQGYAYLIFGSANPTDIDLNGGLTVDKGVLFQGPTGVSRGGYSVAAAGDINGDGIDDLAIGSQYGSSGMYFGDVHVIYGKRSGWTTPIGLSSVSGSVGYMIQGEANDDRFGTSLSPAGDLNGDGIDDLWIGAHSANVSAGGGWVIYGKSGTRSDIVINTGLSASDGYEVTGIGTDLWGYAAGAHGDFNGDGQPDFALTSTQANTMDGRIALIYGDSGAAALGSLASGQGFILDGPTGLSLQAGERVTLAGDLNADGKNDMIISVSRADYGVATNTGSAYVIFGQDGIPLSGANLSSYTGGASGFRVDGPLNNARLARSIATADINGDLCTDLLLGAPNGNNDEAIVIYGGKAQ